MTDSCSDSATIINEVPCDTTARKPVKLQQRTEIKIRERILNYVKAKGYDRASFTYEYYSYTSNITHAFIEGKLECEKNGQKTIYNIDEIRQDAFLLYLCNTGRNERQYEELFSRLLERYRPEGAVVQRELAIEYGGKRYFYDYVVDIDGRRVCIEIGEEHNAKSGDNSRWVADQAKHDYAIEHGWEYHFLNVHTSSTHPLHDIFYQLNSSRHITYYDRMQEWICRELFHVEYKPDADPEITCPMI